ncbi:MAG: hypothetical protein CXR31_03135 [Geobacter sp.]|nr:MAG: hypothetical protein CXR31_03135 [Geobacter sp.]
MKTSSALLLMTACFTLSGGNAFADNITIKYRSGNVQTIRLDEPSSSIASISYQENNASAAEPSPSHPAEPGTAGTDGEAAKTPQKKTGTSKGNGKPEVRIEWAPPVE